MESEYINKVLTAFGGGPAQRRPGASPKQKSRQQTVKDEKTGRQTDRRASILLKSRMEPPLRCVAVEVREPAKSSSTSWLEYCRARDLVVVWCGV